MLRRALGIAIFVGFVTTYYLTGKLSFIDQANWAAIQRAMSDSHSNRSAYPLINFGIVVAEALLVALIVRLIIWRIRGPYVRVERRPDMRYHLPFMHWPRVRVFNQAFWPTAGVVAPFVLGAHHAATYWGTLMIGVGNGFGWNSPALWVLRIFAFYTLIQGIAAVMRPTRQTGNMIRAIIISTIPLFVDAIALYAHFHEHMPLSDYQWFWLEGDLLFVFLLDVIVFSYFMAEIDFYQAPIYRQEALAPPNNP